MAKFTLVLDSSQITNFLECPEQWNNQYQKRLFLVGAIPSEAMNAGTYGHKILDLYYKDKYQGLAFNEAAARAMSYDPDKDTCECGCSVDSHKYLSLINLTECQRCKHCLAFRPKHFELDTSIRMAVQNRLREYFFTYQSNDFKPLSEQHVEVGFSEAIFEDDSNLFVLEGRIDLIGTIQGLNCIVDHKFQLSRHYLYEKSIQFKNYALISKTLMVFINYIRLSKSVDKTTLQRVPVSFTVPELLVWKQELIKIFFRVKQAILNSNFEKCWASCKGYGKTYTIEDPKYCIYRTLCEEYNEDMKVIKEKQLYQIKEDVWRPW